MFRYIVSITTPVPSFRCCLSILKIEILCSTRISKPSNISSRRLGHWNFVFLYVYNFNLVSFSLRFIFEHRRRYMYLSMVWYSFEQNYYCTFGDTEIWFPSAAREIGHDSSTNEWVSFSLSDSRFCHLQRGLFCAAVVRWARLWPRSTSLWPRSSSSVGTRRKGRGHSRSRPTESSASSCFGRSERQGTQGACWSLSRPCWPLRTRRLRSALQVLHIISLILKKNLHVRKKLGLWSWKSWKSKKKKKKKKKKNYRGNWVTKSSWN